MYKRFETVDSLVKGGVCSVKYTDFTCTWYVTCYYVNILVSCYMKNSVEGPHMLTNVINLLFDNLILFIVTQQMGIFRNVPEYKA